ncbi:MAG: hypothetical protein ACLQHF_00260 [Terracidiphilus sp.]
MALAALCFASGVVSHAREPGCAQISLRAQMARAQTSAALNALHRKSASTFRNDLVYAARELELKPSSKTAADRLLDLLPNEGDPNEAAWLDLSGLEDCPSGGFPNHELDAIDRLQYRIPSQLVKAVLRSPEKMQTYVAHTQLFLTPDSDFTIHMQTVCRKQHKAFLKAVDEFLPKDKSWFSTVAFNPETCHTVFYPEQ